MEVRKKALNLQQKTIKTTLITKLSFMKKRILLSLMSFFAMTAMWANLTGAYSLYLTADANGKQGEEATLTLNLKNRNAIATFEATLTLPEGAEPEFSATVNEDGTVTFAFALEGVALTGTDGAVATFKVAVDKTATVGENTLTLSTQKMYEVSGADHTFEATEFKWTIEEGEVAVAGDVNQDGEVTIADFVAVLNAMAGEEVPGDADVNGDGEITIADAVAVLNIMAGGAA